MKVRVKFAHRDPYTWDIIQEDRVINIRSIQAAEKWVRQHYYNVWHVHTICMDYSEDKLKEKNT